MKKRSLFFSLFGFLLFHTVVYAQKNTSYPFRMENLVAWSIAAFDGAERSPSERITMIYNLGFRQYAYGGNHQQMQHMLDEWQIAKEKGIEIKAVWLFLHPAKDKPGKLKPISELLFENLKRAGLHTEIWVGFHKDYFKDKSQDEALAISVAMIAFLAEKARDLGCKIALYNHGGWYGNPRNQLAVIKRLPEYEIGVVYNFHHAHGHLNSYQEDISKLLPYLWCVNLNGMKANGPKIIPIGKGILEKEMISYLISLGYGGPFGILSHVKGADAKLVLQQNINGLHSLFQKN